MSSAPPINSAYNYNSNPGTQSGDGIFGGNPGQVGMPDPYAELSQVYPGLGQTNNALSSNISTELEGGLSPSTLDAISGAQSQYGIPGTVNTSPMSLGTTSTSLENQGIMGWDSLLPTIATTETVPPQVQAEIAMYNAQQAAQADAQSSAAAQAGMSTAISIVGALIP